MSQIKQWIVLIFPIFIYYSYHLEKLNILEPIILGSLLGIYMVLMKSLQKKIRIPIASLHTFLLFSLLIFYVAYPFCSIEFKRTTASLYKFFIDSCYELYFFGGVSLGMMGRWKALELCPYQLLRTSILFSFPLITLVIFYLQTFFNFGATDGLSTLLYDSCFVLWGVQISIYMWMSLRLTKENQRILLLGHGIIFGIFLTILSLFHFTEFHYSYYLNIWGFMSLAYYQLSKINGNI